jgi:hypothetical protein
MPLALQLQNLPQPPTMTLGARESRLQKGPQQIRGELGTDHARTERDDVHVIVLHALAGGEGIMTQSAPDPGKLARRDARADATAAHQHSALGGARSYGAADGSRDVRIVVTGHRFRRSAVYDLHRSRAQLGQDPVAQRPAGMITSERHFHAAALAGGGRAGMAAAKSSPGDPIISGFRAEEAPVVMGVTVDNAEVS